MKSFDKLIIAVIVIMLIVYGSACFALIKLNDLNTGLYRVEMNRIEQELQNGGVPDVDNYEAILSICEYNGEADFFNTDNKYAIREINGRLYRIDYIDSIDNSAQVQKLFDRVFAIIALIILGVLIYLRQNILKPFNEISELPAELAKGKLTMPLKESKSRYFGRFIWGLDMLREELEQSRTQRLERIKAEKTFLLSLSHDIKTPLAAIKLYAKALSKELYSDHAKQLEVAENINSKAGEIESLVNEIISNSNDNIMDFEVALSEFYLSEVMKRISDSYTDKLSETGTLFEIGKYTDCMLSGDADRLAEVLQNIIENAVKYGDGHDISLSFSDEEDCRLITITNSGCTLSGSELSHIFESFWRGSNAGSKQGSGLGLYICRRLMNKMNGDIFAKISGECMNVTVVCPKA